jgi:hypothetical protein
MKPEKQRLLGEVFDETGMDECRKATLLAANRILRLRRWKRRAAQTVAAMVTATLATLVIQRVNSLQNPGAAPVARVAVPAAPFAPIPQMHRLSDDELLALFPRTPVGLVTLKDGRKRLIFPRPGDEQRCIVRL